MGTLGVIFTLITMLLHVYFFILETFLWTKPIGQRVFKITKEEAITCEKLAANQGVYNALLAAGLLLSFLIPDLAIAMAIRKFCLGYIVIVGCYGAYSLGKITILLIQALPALIALLCLLTSN